MRSRLRSQPGARDARPGGDVQFVCFRRTQRRTPGAARLTRRPAVATQSDQTKWSPSSERTRKPKKADLEFYRRLSPAARLEILFEFRARAHKDGAASGKVARV